MAYSDIQNKVGQIQMANQILLAQCKIPPPNEGEGTRDYRKRISGGSYKANRKNKNNPFEGMTDDEQRIEAAKRQEALNKKREEERLDQDPELNKQREDMRQGDYLEDPENPLSDLMKIGGAAAGFGGNILRMLINPLGGNALAMNFEDTGLGAGGFVGTSRTNVFINEGGEAYILEPNGNFKFDGLYAPEIHGPIFPRAQANDDMKIAKLPHSPPTEKIVLPNGKLMDSPLRFKTDQERIRFMEDFSRGYGRYS